VLVDVEPNVQADDAVDVCFHELENEIEIGIILGTMHAQNTNNIWVGAKMAKSDDLAVGPL
jgi:hypothetical protein